MPGKANRRLADTVDDAEGFVFFWNRRSTGSFWLWGFLVLSLLLHTTGFYLFQVVYPSPGRLEPFPARVLILDGKDASNAVLLQELNDKLVFLQPASSGSESRKTIDDFSVSFKPSFADRVPPFRGPVSEEKKSELSDATALPGEISVLPPFQAQKYAQGGIKNSDQRHWSIKGELAGRSVPDSQAVRLDRLLPSIGDGPEIILSVVIGASGVVEKISVKAGKDHPDAQAFIGIVKEHLKFDPASGADMTSVEITIHK